MRRLRMGIGIIFVFAGLVFGGYKVKKVLTEDTVAPVIQAEQDEITVSVADEESTLLQGLTAEDNKDGNLTDSIRVSSMSHFISEGKRTISYVVFDKANQAGTYERTVQYTDYTSPKIHVTRPLRYTAQEIQKEDITEALTAADCLDGDITSEIRTFSDTYFYDLVPGAYPITLQVNNSAGDTCSVPVDVVIIDSTDQNEVLKYYPMFSEYIIYTKVNVGVDVLSRVIGLEQNGREYLYESDPELKADTLGRVAVSSTVDYATPGVYPVECSYTSNDGITAVTKLYIVVEGTKDGE